MIPSLTIDLFCKMCPGVIPIKVEYRYHGCWHTIFQGIVKQTRTCPSCGVTFAGSSYSDQIEAELFEWVMYKLKRLPHNAKDLETSHEVALSAEPDDE